MKTIKYLTLLASTILTITAFSGETNAAPVTNAGTCLVNTAGCRHRHVWVSGHYKINRYGRMVWVPGHWRRI